MDVGGADRERRRKRPLWIMVLAVAILAAGCGQSDRNSDFQMVTTAEAAVSATDEARSREDFDREMAELPKGVTEATVHVNSGTGTIVERRAIPGNINEEILIVYTAAHVVTNEDGTVHEGISMRPIGSTIKYEETGDVEKDRNAQILREVMGSGDFHWSGEFGVATEGVDFAVVAIKVPKDINNYREYGHGRVVTEVKLAVGQNLKSLGFPNAANQHGGLFMADMNVKNNQEVGGAIELDGVGSPGSSGEAVYDEEGNLVGIGYAYSLDGGISLWMQRIPKNVDALTDKAVEECLGK